MNRDEQIISLGKAAAAKAGYLNSVVKCVKIGEGGPGAVHKDESAGTSDVMSDSGSVSFSLTWNQYDHATDDEIIAAIRRASLPHPDDE